METCTPGVFDGLYTVEFAGASFEDCASGHTMWFEGGGNVSCPPGVWLRVEGEVCGPGHYGHLGQTEYELHGEIVLGPCEASCGDDPSDEACTSFDSLCPFYGCDAQAQDCERGFRCAPTSADDAPPWTGTQCVPIDEPVQPVGGACSPAGQWASDCEATAYCVGDEPGGEGVCAPLCSSQLGDCDVGTCRPCAFERDAFEVGVCSETELEC
jgi:hypothetical protein